MAIYNLSKPACFNFQEREVKTGGGARMKMKRRKEN
jgi:hypothetical protein